MVVDVAKLRASLGLTQEVFAGLCAVSLGTLRNWEQQRRRPTGPSRALLVLIQANPAAAIRVLTKNYPEGWTEDRVRRLIRHYDAQSPGGTKVTSRRAAQHST